MFNYAHLQGQRFGKLVIVRKEKSLNPRNNLLTKCDCGRLHYTNYGRLNSGDVSSCGCQRDITTATKHVWNRLVRHNAVGTEPSWLSSYDSFINDVGLKPSRDHQLLKIIPSDPFTKKNSFWGKLGHNHISANRYNTRTQLTFGKQTKTLRQWCEELSINCDVVRKRLNTGMPIEKALSMPVRHKNTGMKIKINGVDYTLPKATAILGIHYNKAVRRYKEGMTGVELLEACST